MKMNAYTKVVWVITMGKFLTSEKILTMCILYQVSERVKLIILPLAWYKLGY